MEQNIEYASLYEYLGRRAGAELGKVVFSEAKRQRIRCKTIQVKQGGYDGKVMCYPISFLKTYFFNTNIQGSITSNQTPSTSSSQNYQTY